jgi:hypothetical protein
MPTMFSKAVTEMNKWQSNDLFIHYDNIDLSMANILDSLEDKNLQGIEFHLSMLKFNLDVLFSEIEEVLDEYEKKDASDNKKIQEITQTYGNDSFTKD